MAGFLPKQVLPAFSFVGFLLVGFTLLPLFRQRLQSINTGRYMYSLWITVGCLMWFVNAIVWSDNVVNWAPVWCDISARYLVGSSVGVAASSCCMVRRLYHATKLKRTSVDKKEERREILVDLLIGFGFPCLVMTSEYVVQPRRFIILEQIGCHPALVNTMAEYFLVAIWPLVFSFISFIYAVLIFRKTFLIRVESNGTFQSLRTAVSAGTGSYWRLAAFCSAEILFTLPMGVYYLAANVVSTKPVPYVSWSSIHSGFSHIDQYPADEWQSMHNIAIGVELTRWIYVVCALSIFGFFGWSEEVRGFYHRAFRPVCRYVWHTKSTLPIPVNTAVSRRRRRSLSLSSMASSCPESLWTSSRLSVGEEQADENAVELPLHYPAHPTNDSLATMPSVPPVALTRDRYQQPLISNLDISQA